MTIAPTASSRTITVSLLAGKEASLDLEVSDQIVKSRARDAERGERGCETKADEGLHVEQ